MASPLRKSAIAGGVLVGLLAASWLIWRTDEPGADDAGSAKGAAAHHSSGGWMPWFSGAGKAAPALPDLYEGPRVDVPVRVVDLQGAAVSGADVEMRVEPDEWQKAIQILDAGRHS